MSLGIFGNSCQGREKMLPFLGLCLHSGQNEVSGVSCSHGVWTDYLISASSTEEIMPSVKIIETINRIMLDSVRLL